MLRSSPILQQPLFRIMSPHPNSYTFSKRLAETVAWDMRNEVPLAIGRPSIGISSIFGLREVDRGFSHSSSLRASSRVGGLAQRACRAAGGRWEGSHQEYARGSQQPRGGHSGGYSGELFDRDGLVQRDERVKGEGFDLRVSDGWVSGSKRRPSST